MKLRARFVLFSIFLTTVIVFGTSYATLHFLQSLVLKEIETSQVTLVENLKKVCEESLISRDDILAYNYVSSLEKTVKGLAYAAFVDSQRNLILGKNEALAAAIGGDEAILARGKEPLKGEDADSRGETRKEALSAAGGRRVLSYGAEVGNSGKVYLGFYEDKVEENIRDSIQRITRIIIFVSIGAFGIGLVISLLFAIQLTGPIQQLAEGAQAIGEGNLDTQIDIKREDELGLLAREFNTMAVKLKELDSLKDAFVSSVSHELRSPLTAISGYVELLTMKPVHELNPEKVSKALNIIQESTTRLTQFVNDVLDVAKIKAGKMDLHKTNFDVKATGESVMGLFAPLFEKKKIQARLVIPAEVPPVPADAEKVRQVITNLLSNAYKFTPDGGTITMSAAVQNGGVKVTVQDSGIGIPKESQHLIFGKFQQVPGGKQSLNLKGPKGTGLGLAIAKGIVEAHGGTIGFESDEGKGTRFFFTLPLHAETGSQAVQAKTLA